MAVAPPLLVAGPRGSQAITLLVIVLLSGHLRLLPLPHPLDQSDHLPGQPQLQPRHRHRSPPTAEQRRRARCPSSSHTLNKVPHAPYDKLLPRSPRPSLTSNQKSVDTVAPPRPPSGARDAPSLSWNDSAITSRAWVRFATRRGGEQVLHLVKKSHRRRLCTLFPTHLDHKQASRILLPRIEAEPSAQDGTSCLLRLGTGRANR